MGGRGASKTRANATYRHPINVTSGEISEETMRMVNTAIERAAGLFSVDPITRIVATERADNEFAACKMNDGILFLNTKWFDDLDDLKAEYARTVRARFHPKGTTWESVIDHEVGHALEPIINAAYMARNKIPETNYEYSERYKGIEDIVTQATETVRKRSLFATGKSVQSGLSRYAARNYHETFAEAVADYTANGPKANALSKEIIRIAKDMVK